RSQTITSQSSQSEASSETEIGNQYSGRAVFTSSESDQTSLSETRTNQTVLMQSTENASHALLGQGNSNNVTGDFRMVQTESITATSSDTSSVLSNQSGNEVSGNYTKEEWAQQQSSSHEHQEQGSLSLGLEDGVWFGIVHTDLTAADWSLSSVSESGNDVNQT